MELVTASPTAAVDVTRISQATAFGAGEQLTRLLQLARRGLGSAYLPQRGEFAQTLRATSRADRVRVAPEGNNLRYTAMALLGIDRLDVELQRELLDGQVAAALSWRVEALAQRHRDPGAVALAAWMAAELTGHCANGLFARMASWLAGDTALPTVDVAWMLTAAEAAHGLGNTGAVAERAAERLLAEQGALGIFPHALPARSQGRWRRHVGSFADQIYPVQALARWSARSGDAAALEAAEQTALQLCECQGPAGQWWWHYDVRTGRVVEQYPVYSVHQHAMAPMALFDLAAAGGTDHSSRILLGLQWLECHPEVVEELESQRHGVVWRKVGRREPAKAARRLGALTTSLRPGLRLPALTRLLPPERVDHECRPYELGWLLYAWLGPRQGSGHA